MTDKEAIRALYSAIGTGDLRMVKEVIGSVPARLEMEVPTFGTWLHYAANRGEIEIVMYLVRLGANVNRRSGLTNAAPIYEAASEGRDEVVRYLLSRTAELEVTESTANPLFGAIQGGHTGVAKLLIESGIDTRVKYSGDSMKEMDALAFAREWGRHDIAELLIASGCEDDGKTGRHPAPPHPLMEHIRSHFGSPSPLSLGQVLPSGVPVNVHVVPQAGGTLALVTTGMSSEPLPVPPGQELYQYAELVMVLPGDWPHGPESLSKPEYSWPYQWVQRIAAFPHESETWLGLATVFDCGGPLAPNTSMDCLLAYSEETDVGLARLADGRNVVFYFLVPLYPEEHDFQKQEGVQPLLDRLRQGGFDKKVAINRPNLALPA